MKKLLLVLLALVMCISMCSCGDKSSKSSTTKTKEEPILNVRQELVNICCDYSKCSTVKGFEIGTQNKTPITDGYKVSAKGSYWVVDEYGTIGDYMTFDIEFKATWDGKSSYHNIQIIKKSIKKKY